MGLMEGKSFMKNLKIKSKLFLGFGVMLIAILTVAAVSIVSTQRIRNNYSDALEYNIYRHSNLQGISTHLMDIRRITSQIALHGGEYGNALGIEISGLQRELNRAIVHIDNYVDSYIANLNRAPNITDDVRSTSRTNIIGLHEMIHKYISDITEAVMREAQNGNREAAARYTRNGLGIMRDIYSLYNAMMHEYNFYMDNVVYDMNATAKNSISVLTIISIIAIIVSVLATLVISNMITAPITRVVSSFKKVSKGKLNVGLKVDSSDEVGMLNKAALKLIATLQSLIDEMDYIALEQAKGNFDVFINEAKFENSFGDIANKVNRVIKAEPDLRHKVVDVFSKITDATGQVLSGSKQISQSAVTLVRDVRTQASSVESLSASVDLIHKQTRTNAESAERARDISARSTTHAKEGNEAMRQMLDAMSGVQESSSNISKIIKTITDIGFQAKLLSLNASVEAARAGEHGRGFAVLADEVHILATRNQKVASDTNELMQFSEERIEAAANVASTTAVSLDTIVSGVSEISGIINSIHEDLCVQANVIDQISIGLLQISDLIQSSSVASEETAAAAEKLNSQAEILQQLVAYFKL